MVKLITSGSKPWSIAGSNLQCCNKKVEERGWLFMGKAKNIINSFMKTRRWPSASATSTTPSVSAPSLPSEPVKFSIAGAQMEAEPGLFRGQFHPIPLGLWSAIVGFHRQVSINIKGESVTYHRWHAASGQYHTLIPFQKSRKHGLSVNVNWNDPRNKELLDRYATQFGEEFLPACTIHTHVDIAAFESGTDARDEEETPGWHITLGKLLSHGEYDIDFRMRLPKTKSLKQIVNVNKPYSLSWENLFIGGKGVREWVYQTPGSTDFHTFLNRVDAS